MVDDINLGWRGKKVKNEDGREGVIQSETIGLFCAGLNITVDGAKNAYVQLNARRRDSGETGWSWWCETFISGPKWLKLGDHW